MVLVRCEGCDNLHLIADNYGWFKDTKVNIEDIMKEKGDKVHRFITNEALEFTHVEPEEEVETDKKELN